MNKNRIKQLLTFYSEDPNDPFTIYALANEFKDEDPKKALEYFEILIRNHPKYTATYYHLGHLYISLEEIEKAKSIFEKGIEIATMNNDTLALRELKNAYNELMMGF